MAKFATERARMGLLSPQDEMGKDNNGVDLFLYQFCHVLVGSSVI